MTCSKQNPSQTEQKPLLWGSIIQKLFWGSVKAALRGSGACGSGGCPVSAVPSWKLALLCTGTIAMMSWTICSILLVFISGYMVSEPGSLEIIWATQHPLQQLLNFSFLATSPSYGSSWVSNRTCATTVTWATAIGFLTHAPQQELLFSITKYLKHTENYGKYKQIPMYLILTYFLQNV